MNQDNTLKGAFYSFIFGFLVMSAIMMFFAGWRVVGTGEVGIRTRFGAITGTVLEPGLHFKTPFIAGVKKVDIRTQKVEADASAASSDLQTVTSKIALNFRVDKAQVVTLYSQVGQEYQLTVVAPALQEAVKATTAKYTASDLISKRQQVSDEIQQNLTERVNKYGVIVEDINILDFDFSKSFNEAIEAKVTAEQNAIASKNKLEQIKYEAEQAVAAAKGKAEAQRIEGEALRSNPELIELRAIETWDGKLPQYMTGSQTPFINVAN